MTSNPFFTAAVVAASLLAAAASTGSARAQDCLHWGDLDKTLYCDESRDLVADTPSEGFRLQDPDILVFSYTPAGDPSIGQKTFVDFMNHLAMKTGKAVRWHGASSSAEQIKAMRAGEVHVAGIAPGATVYAVNLAGYVPIAAMCSADGTFGERLKLIVEKDSGIDSTAQLKGRKVAVASALAVSGRLAPEGSKLVDSGSQGNSISGVVSGEYDAAIVSANVLERMAAEGAVDAGKLHTLDESSTFPSTSFGFANNLSPDLQRKVHDAFVTFDWKMTALGDAFGREASEFCTITYADAWEPVRLMQKESGVEYDIKDL